MTLFHTSLADMEDIVEIDSLAWKVAQKYLDKGHPCNQFLVKAFETRFGVSPCAV